jgi:hypothetical protein
LKWLAAKTLRSYEGAGLLQKIFERRKQNPGIIASKPVILAGLHLSDHAEFPEAAVGRAWGPSRMM